MRKALQTATEEEKAKQAGAEKAKQTGAEKAKPRSESNLPPGGSPAADGPTVDTNIVLDQAVLRKLGLYQNPVLDWGSSVKVGSDWYRPTEQKVWFVPVGVDDNCPFVAFISIGAFVYFNYRYDVVGINAMRFTELQRDEEKTPAKLFYGAGSPLPKSVIRPLREAGRWEKVTVKSILDYGFTHYTWILPSEFIADHIFPKDGGFAYLHGRESKSAYYPIVAPSQEEILSPIEYKSELQVPEITQWLLCAGLPPGERPTLSPDKFSNHEKFAPEDPSITMRFEKGKSAALGVERLLGFQNHELEEHKQKKTLESRDDGALELLRIVNAGFATEAEITEALERNQQACKDSHLRAMHLEMLQAAYYRPEDKRLAGPDDMHNLVEVLYKRATEREVKSNANSDAKIIMDKGRRGETLVDFFSSEQARKCNLSIEEVAALRLYTTSTYKLINNPLRDRVMPHPLAITTFYLYGGLKKLRGLNFAQTGDK